MKREDVLDAAKKCGFFFHDAGYAPILHTLPREYSERMFERLVNLVEQATLERAANKADSVGHHWSGAPARAFFELADEIRALKDSHD